MALSVVGTLVGKLADSALNKALELYNVSDKVEPLRMELDLITAILKDADAKCNKNPQVKQWVNELRDLGYRIEDALDTFLVDVEGKKRPSNTAIRKLMRAGTKPRKVSNLCDEIRSVTGMLRTLHERGTQMRIQDINEVNHPISTQLKPKEPYRIDDSAVVGLDSAENQIIGHLLDTNIKRRTVLSIVGTGGLGKTTLAQKIYKSVQLEKNFHIRIWLPISQNFDENNLLRQILYSIEKKYRQPPVRDEDLLEEVKRALNVRRYLIILDDVWTVEPWDKLQYALPDKNNTSRVLITTRKLDVARAADYYTKPFKPHYLNDDESMALLFRKAFQKPIHPDKYPSDLKLIAKCLIKKCGGLPLAIIVLGGILSKRGCNPFAWKNVENTLDWHNDDADKCSEILALSYHDLPYKYKPCFLYLASFPEDYEISANHITKMWVAEGFIPKDGVGTMEDRAKDFLAELVQRCLVDVTEKLSSGRCKTCKMHDLLRDLATHEAKNDNFLNVFSKPNDEDLVDLRQIRRAALRHCTSIEYDLLSNTRTLICFGKQMLYYPGFSLLRVLNFDRNDSLNYIHAKKQAIHEGWLKCLIHLKFLGFRHCRNYFGFGNVSFSYLNNLETFDITGTITDDVEYNVITDEPNDSLWKVPTLRNVISTYPIRGPSRWDRLKNIQTVKWVRLENVPVLTNHINLHKLGVCIDDPDILERTVASHKHSGPVKSIIRKVINRSMPTGSMAQERNVWHILEGLLRWTPSMVSLSIRYLPENKPMFPANGSYNLPCHTNLYKLNIFGWWASALSFEMLPRNLFKLTLVASKLMDDPMPILESLPCLSILNLLENSYMGTTMICSARGFPSLNTLKLQTLPDLSEWEIREGAMRILNYLTINDCRALNTNFDLQNVPSLQELVVNCTSVELDRRMQSEDNVQN